MFRRTFIHSALALMFGFAAASVATAHGEGPDHHDAPPVVQSSASPSLESVGAALELVAVANGHALTIYLDNSASNAPVSDAEIDVTSDDQPTLRAHEHSPGIYEVESDWFETPGAKPLIFTVRAAETIELLNGTLTINDTAATADAHDQLNVSDVLHLPIVWLISALAAMLGFIIAFAFRPKRLSDDDTTAPVKKAADSAKTITTALAVCLVTAVGGAFTSPPAFGGPGHDHAHDAEAAPTTQRTPRRSPDGTLFVPKETQRLLALRTMTVASSSARPATELIGTIISDPTSEGHIQSPMDGQITLADDRIAHVGQRVKAGDVLANLTPSIPVFDRGSLQQLTAEVVGKIRIAEQRLARLKRISSVVAQKDIDDTKTELDSLHEQKRVLAPKDTEVIELKAPVSGIIAASNVRAGQVVSARDMLFDIVDPEKLWVEVSGIGGRDDARIVSAEAVDGEGHRIALTYIGQAPILRDHAHPILFRVDDVHPALIIGSVVKVLAQSDPETRGLILPEKTIVRADNGLQQVWVKLSPERFAARSIVFAPVDGARVVVTSGLREGDRVVTDGAELINQVR